MSIPTQESRTINPLTALVTGFSAWLVVLGLNNPWVSLLVVIASFIVGFVGSGGFGVAWTSLALSVPVTLSMVIVHAPFGDNHLARFITTDGLLLAGELGLRFLALMAAILAAMTFAPIPQLVKALQATRLHPSISYIAGAALQFLPQAKRAIVTVHEAHFLLGNTSRNPLKKAAQVAIPVMVQALFTGADRALAVEVAGVGLPGRRTVLRPVADSRFQKALRWIVPACAIVLVLYKSGGWL
ncbi:energy-coupling factor transporter transmembrane component T [Corynebacterium sp. SCR221107]|uniref:energy-coupling factor transporter transmembrane component T n=1 Tax=Corynebacterium sp. SCR221107 TaxID=3017361 RepID=UPI0022EC6015|nr:energy-coupling factor transporter transmembrane component T [Corynebacterium sp. SCR221107]WBT09740.1 energy-coupling factor transporter transmembrane component T [Corynebacterium sp. SCR221107]